MVLTSMILTVGHAVTLLALSGVSLVSEVRWVLGNWMVWVLGTWVVGRSVRMFEGLEMLIRVRPA